MIRFARHQFSPSLSRLAALIAVPALTTTITPSPRGTPVRNEVTRDSTTTDSPFIVKPYLQIGEAQSAGSTVVMSLMWHTDTTKADWSVDVKPAGSNTWSDVPTFWGRRIITDDVPPHTVYEGTFGNLKPGSEFQYRVKRNGTIVFSATGHARKAEGQPFRTVLFGDCGVNGKEQKQVAYRAYLQHPDIVGIAGDIVYGSGRMSEYRTNFFPIYNADSANPGVGAPLERTVPFFAAFGNHDAGYPAGYFNYWSMPLNGPTGRNGKFTPSSDYWRDSAAARKVEQEASAGGKYPQMSNYSFDYGNAHWLVLDANTYVNWTDPRLRNWVARDLATSKATWKFVMFHQPGFNSSRAHFSEQQMRILAPVFEAGGADIVFAGHVHNYQRSYPLKFLPNLIDDPKFVDGKVPEQIDGDFTLDKDFDGAHRTNPKGVIYIVTGAGGAGLYTPEQTGDPKSWQPFTKTFIAERYSLSVMDINGRTLTFRQLGADGVEVDHFVITKPGTASSSVHHAHSHA